MAKTTTDSERTSKTASAGAAQPAPAPLTLCGAISQLRTVATDRTRHAELPEAKRRLRALVRSRIVEPLRQKADEEPDPMARFNWFSLAGLVEEETRLYLECIFAELEGTKADPERDERRTRLAIRIEKLQKALNHGGQPDFRW